MLYAGLFHAKCHAAISEHKRQEEMIKQLTDHYNHTHEELIASRRDANELKQEVRQLRQEYANLASQTSHPIPAGMMPLPPQQQPQPQPPTPMETYPPESYPRAVPHRPEPRPELPLPPMRAINTLNTPLQAGPDTMTGVQYQVVDRASNINGYRPGYPSRA